MKKYTYHAPTLSITSVCIFALSTLRLSVALALGVFTLTACDDSGDSQWDVTLEEIKPQGTWQAHTCEMAIPEGLTDADFNCGTFTVPADWDDPGDEKVSFEVAVLKAKDSDPAPDPFVYLGGGPGDWNLENIAARMQYLPPIAESRDIIFFDKRGNGLSQPSLFCAEYFEKTLESYRVITDISDDVDTWLLGYRNCHTRLKDEAVNLSNFHSYQVGFDLVSLMDVLGYQTYNLYGISYGTREAQVAMRDHPEMIRSVILDSTSLPANPRYAANFARSYELLFADCAASSACASNYPNLVEVMVAVVERLNDIPYYTAVTLDDGTTVDFYATGDRFVTAVHQGLYNAGILNLVPEFIYKTFAGDMTLLDALIPLVLKTSGYDRGLYASTHCIENVPFTRVEDVISAKENLNPILTDPVYEVTNRLLFDLCEFWQVNPRPAGEDELVESDIPTLVLAGRYDPITPPADGEKLAEGLSNSQYFLFNGLSHGILSALSTKPGEPSCSMKMALQFLADPKAPVDGACASELPGPFD